jgi:hypothetical protein
MGLLQRHHLFAERLNACKDRGKGIGNRHQRHGNTPRLADRAAF